MASTERIVLDNGLVLLMQQKSGDTALMLATKSGYYTDPPCKHGLAHLCEHIILNQGITDKYRTLFEYSDTKCIEFTGSTSATHQLFTLKNISRKNIPFAIAFLHNRLSAEESELTFQAEKKRLLREIYNDNDLPTTNIDWYVYNTLTKKTPYVISYNAELAALSTITQEDIKHFKQKYLVPNNFFLVALGSFPHKEFAHIINALFSTLPARPVTLPDLPLISNKAQTITLPSFFGDAYLQTTKAIGHLNDLDYAALFIIDHILGDTHGRLFQEISYKRGLTYHIETSVSTTSKNFIQYSITIDGFASENLQEIQHLITEQLHDLATHPLRKEELEKSKKQTLNDDTDSILESLVHKEFFGLPSAYDLEDLIPKVTSKRIKNVVQKYLIGDYTTVISLPETTPTQE